MKRVPPNEIASASGSIAEDSVTAADRVIDDILSVSQRMGEFPDSGQHHPELGLGVRGVPLGNYMIYYRIEPDVVRVLRVLHSSQDAQRQFDTD